MNNTTISFSDEFNNLIYEQEINSETTIFEILPNYKLEEEMPCEAEINDYRCCNKFQLQFTTDPFYTRCEINTPSFSYIVQFGDEDLFYIHDNIRLKGARLN